MLKPAIFTSQVFDSEGNFLQVIGRSGIMGTIFGTQGSGQGAFNTPSGIALTSGEWSSQEIFGFFGRSERWNFAVFAIFRLFFVVDGRRR